MTRYNEASRLSSIYKQAKVNNGCLEWQGTLDNGGYAFISWNLKIWKGHRLVWFLEKKEMPKKLILHKCDNRRCINISHLYEGDYKDNMRDQLQRGRHHFANRTHCKNGHEFTPENTVKDGHSRRCRICKNTKRMERWHAKGY